jgi:two-component system LytT family response regulator
MNAFMNEKIRCVIVDDESLARQLVRTCMALDPHLELVGEAAEADAAVSLIEATHPDLLFLDIQMPEINGLELLRVLESEQIPIPLVIFVTAYDRYALRAFEESAVDYLLKPFDERRFQKAVASARKRLRAEKMVAQASLQRLFFERMNERVPIRACGGRIYFVRTMDIDWIEADGNYLRLHVANNEHEIRETMQSFEARLAGLPFSRIHRSVIINLERVKEVRPWYTGEYSVHLSTGKELTLTRTYRDRFFQATGRVQPKS